MAAITQSPRKTRERKASGTPSTATAQGRRKAAEESAAKGQSEAKGETDEAKEAKAQAKAEEKAQREAEKKAEKEAKEAERKAEREAKEAARAEERQGLIDSGDLIEVEENGEVVMEFNATEPKKDDVAQRAARVIEDLKADGREIPVAGKELADKYGGGTVQWVAFFGMLRILGLVRAYRFKTGERGKSGMAYLWIGEDE